jgi:ATP-binding cassette, subfamily B, bacterial
MNVTKETIKLFWHYMWRYRRFAVWLIIGVTFVELVGELLLPYVISDVLQSISQSHYDPRNVWSSFGTSVTVYIAGMIASRIIGWRIVVWLIWQLELHVERDLAQDIFAHLMRMSANFHANRFGGSLVSQANKLTSAYDRFADTTILSLYRLLLSLVAAAIILAPRVPVYALTLIIGATTFIACAILLSRRVRQANATEAEAQSRQTGYLADALTNLLAVKSFAAAKQEQKRYQRATQATYDAGAFNLKLSNARDFYTSLVTSGISITALCIAIVGVGVLHANIATIFLIVTYTNTIASKLWDFQTVLRNYNRAFGDASDMVKILHIQPEVQDSTNPEPVRIKSGTISFDNVDFTHQGSEKEDALFRGLSLHIAAGEKVGLVGHSGSGKTTLTRLLLRFSDIDGGKITIDGQNIAAITQNDLRHAISYVPQEPLLFHRSIAENIAYGKPDATQEEITAAARKAQAHEFIQKLPHEYGTLVGERGVKLSGGQRQRIAIARAILKNAPILVLDEATSALDSESERLIQAALDELMKRRTAIVIAHRLSTVQKLDRIIVLREGKIIEEGDHKQLLVHGGEYARLWTHQSGGFIEE